MLSINQIKVYANFNFKSTIIVCQLLLYIVLDGVYCIGWKGGRVEGGRWKMEGGRVEGGRVEGGRVEGGRVEGGRVVRIYLT